MNINYEVGFWILFVMNAISLAFLASMASKINDLTMKFDAAYADIRNQIGKVYGKLKMISTDIDDLTDIVEDLCDCDEDECDDEDTDGEPEPQENIVQIEEDPIHLITQNQYFFEQGHDKFDLVYYSDTGELRFYFANGVDFDEPSYIVIDNVEECIGDGLRFFGVNSKNERFVYIRNNIFKADFVIEKVA